MICYGEEIRSHISPQEQDRSHVEPFAETVGARRRSCESRSWTVRSHSPYSYENGLYVLLRHLESLTLLLHDVVKVLPASQQIEESKKFFLV